MGWDWIYGSQNTTTLLSEPISTFLPHICQWKIGQIVKSCFQTTFSQPASLDSPPKGSSPASPCTRVKEKISPMCKTPSSMSTHHKRLRNFPPFPLQATVHGTGESSPRRSHSFLHLNTVGWFFPP